MTLADTGPIDVLVIGGGPIGACCAQRLAARGARVAVLERAPGWGSDCAAASAGWICPSFSGPFAKREDLADALRWLLRRDSPLALRGMPGLLPWLLQLAAATRAEAAADCAAVLATLARAGL